MCSLHSNTYWYMQISHRAVKLLQYFSTGFNTVQLLFSWLNCLAWACKMRPSWHIIIVGLLYFKSIKRQPHHYFEYAENRI